MDSRRLVKAGRHHHVARLHTTAVKLGSPLVVDADNAASRIVVREQQRLRLEVRLERVVVVEVVLRQVGERRHRETRIPRAAQIERMGADLHGDAIAFRIAHAREQMLQVARLGGGVLGLLVRIADGRSDGADNARLLPRHARDVLDEVGRGGLAVGPRDADE